MIETKKSQIGKNTRSLEIHNRNQVMAVNQLVHVEYWVERLQYWTMLKNGNVTNSGYTLYTEEWILEWASSVSYTHLTLPTTPYV